MRAFWMAWGLAVLLIVAGTLGAMGIFAVSAGWTMVPRVLATVFGIALLICALVGAFRSGFLGTMALKQVLAENLAIVIAMELDDLRRAAEQRAMALNEEVAASRAPQGDGHGPLAVPKFFGERDEIGQLLGKATEHTLEDIYASLQSFNDAARVGAFSDAESRQRMRGKAAAIQEQVTQAARLLSPFLPSRGFA